MMNQYIQQFVGENVIGTRFRTHHIHSGGSSGFVYDCITAQEALDKSRLKLQRHCCWWSPKDILQLIEVFDVTKGSRGEKVVARFIWVDEELVKCSS